MILKYPRDLRAQDLPLIESPFFATSKVRSILTSFYAHERNRLELPREQAGRYRSHQAQADELCARVAAGELLLVYSDIRRNELVSPVVTWRSDDGGPGQWCYEESRHLSRHIPEAVAALNRERISPDDLEATMGIGGMSAGDVEMELRAQRRQQREREAGAHASTNPTAALAAALPLAAVAPVEANPEQQQKAEEPPLEIVAGLFTDGTLNNVDNIETFERRVEQECLEPMRKDPSKQAECEERLRLLMGESYAGAATNVAKLWQLYDDSSQQAPGKGPVVIKVYSPGAGTKTGENDSLIGMATGLGETGVFEQVNRLFMELASQIRNLNTGDRGYRIVFDLFGFSRGGAAARHAVNEIVKGKTGMLSQAMRRHNLELPEAVEIRFVGLFDTVAGIVNLSDLDFSPGNDRNSPVNLHLNRKDVAKAVQLVAGHEKRENFALNSLRDAQNQIPENFREIIMPGAHSDIGGGYPDEQIEEVLVYPVLSIRGSSVQWPVSTIEWDNLEDFRSYLAGEGWIGEHSFMLPDGEHPSLKIKQRRIDHPAPDGQVLLSLRMTRHIKGHYSRIALRIMHDLASAEEVPLAALGSNNESESVPDELRILYEKFTKQLASGAQALTLEEPENKRILQRYIHHSDHYNLMESAVGDDLLRYEFPFDEIHPFRPATRRNRVVHPNHKMTGR
ncbi:DUF2235 domain-containing protein [Marinobacter sp.]|uniref:phospholipase effector Tle1 domain-containing protein n=1 Tax=Marinobacter sp. TaxID=50741 RepID=UPI0034A12697